MLDAFAKEVLKWAADVIVILVGAIGSLSYFILRGDRRRLSAVEEKVANAITKTEVMVIVKDVEGRVRIDHERIVNELRNIKDDLREDIQELRRALTSQYQGPDRRSTTNRGRREEE